MTLKAPAQTSAAPPCSPGPLPELNVVIPARKEAALLNRCLRALMYDSTNIRLRVIVVVNGTEGDETANTAKALAPAFAARGHTLLVRRIAPAGKARALNVGDADVREGAIVYLDADVVVLPGTLKAICEALSRTASPLLVCPAPYVVYSGDWLAKCFGALWGRLVRLRRDAIGAGCYAVNAAGRSKWGRFPDLAADDAFVCAQFAPNQRRLLEGGGFYFQFPTGAALVAMRRRWRRAVLALRAQSKMPVPHESFSVRDKFARAGRILSAVASEPRLWGSIPAYVLVNVVSSFPFLDRAHATQSMTSDAWIPDRSQTRLPTASSAELKIVVAVVTYNSEAHIEACLASITSHWAMLDVRIWDNASSDSTVALVERAFPQVKVFRSQTNVGFGQAINDLLTNLQSDEMALLANPDTVLEPNTIDALLSLQVRFPEAGLYGGRAVDERGRVDPSTCLALPTIGQALAFATCVSLMGPLRLFDPDQLGGWRREGVRQVPVLTGSLLLVDGGLWRRTGGFNSTLFLYGEDVDLCVRARRMGAFPMFSAFAVYRHIRGASSPSRGARLTRLYTAKIQLYGLHLPPGARRIAILATYIGIWLRKAAERLLSRKSRPWKEVSLNLRAAAREKRDQEIII